MNETACPTVEALCSFHLGALGEDGLEAIGLHLESCRSCNLRMETMEDLSDAMIEALRHPSGARTAGPPPAQSTVDAIAPGDVVGEYEILEPIAIGGMAKVFKARHRAMNRPVAMKFLSFHAQVAAGAAKRFQREIEAAAQLMHPNIVVAHDAGQYLDAHYLVMEFVQGQTLSALVKQQGPLPVAKAVDYITQAGEGLAYLHAQGIVHRDVKPCNLMVDDQGRVKLLDVGLARLTAILTGHQEPEQDAVSPGDLTERHVVVGSLAYMAPEQARGARDLDHRADIYSLGCTLYYLLHGRPPYSGDTVLAMLSAHLEQPIPSLRRSRRDVPSGLASIFRRMLAKKPQQRFATTQACLRALGDQSRRRPRVRRRIAGVAVACLAVVAVYWQQTNYGELAVFGLPDGTSVQVTRAGKAIALVETRDGPPTRVRPGEYELRLRGDAYGLRLVSTRAQVERAGRTPVHVERALVPLRPPMDAPAAQRERDRWADHLGLPVTQVNSIGMALFFVPPGSRVDEAGTDMEALYFAAHEVTVAQFRSFVEDSGYQPDSVTRSVPGGFVLSPDGSAVYVRGARWDRPGFEITSEDMPVVMVSWNDAVAFCRWLSEREGQSYRLPTPTEWVWGHRATSRDRFFFGSDGQRLVEYGWVRPNSEHVPQPVGQLAANPWGLFDTYGNVREWAWVESAAAPEDLRTGRRPVMGSTIAMGPAHISDDDSRTSLASDFCTSILGFRVVREIGAAGDGIEPVTGLHQEGP